MPCTPAGEAPTSTGEHPDRQVSTHINRRAPGEHPCRSVPPLGRRRGRHPPGCLHGHRRGAAQVNPCCCCLVCRVALRLECAWGGDGGEGEDAVLQAELPVLILGLRALGGQELVEALQVAQIGPVQGRPGQQRVGGGM